jgi:hypothetical protein
MPNVLIVSPHFAPVNAPDMHRVRLALPHLCAHNWSATVLAIAPELVEGATIDHELSATLPADVPIRYARGIPYQWTRRLGFGSLWLRCGKSVQRAGDDLLAKGNFDLVFISTSQFGAFNLGPRWRKRFGVPFVIDFQDPWVNEHYHVHKTPPPGGWTKYRWAQYQARKGEPAAVLGAGGIVCVSGQYGPKLQQRYATLNEDRIHHIPFGASSIDLEVGARITPEPDLLERADDLIHHVYTGRCTPSMRPALDILFKAFAHFMERSPARAKIHRFHFIGTNYAPAHMAEHTVLPAARSAGVEKFVSEHTGRVGYFEAVNYTTRADSILIMGSNDSSYNPSKLNGSLITRSPLLLIAHQKSALLNRAQHIGLKYTFAFSADQTATNAIGDLLTRWFEKKGFAEPPPEEVSRHVLSAEAMTDQLVRCFNLAASKTSP